MTAEEQIAQDLRRLDGMIARARSEIARGGVLDLEPLRAAVNEVCAAIDGLPRDEGRRLRPALVALLDELDGFGGQVESGLDALARELGKHGRRRDAVSAYGKGGKP